MLKEVNEYMRSYLSSLNDRDLEFLKDRMPELERDISIIQQERAKQTSTVTRPEKSKKKQEKGNTVSRPTDDEKSEEPSGPKPSPKYQKELSSIEDSHQGCLGIMLKIQLLVTGDIQKRTARIKRAIQGEDQSEKKKSLIDVSDDLENNVSEIIALAKKFPDNYKGLYLKIYNKEVSFAGEKDFAKNEYYDYKIAPKIYQEFLKFVKPLIGHIRLLIHDLHRTKNWGKELQRSQKLYGDELPERYVEHYKKYRQQQTSHKQKFPQNQQFPDIEVYNERESQIIQTLNASFAKLENTLDYKKELAIKFDFRRSNPSLGDWDYLVNKSKSEEDKANMSASAYPDRRVSFIDENLKLEILKEISNKSARYANSIGGGTRRFYNYSYSSLSKSLMLNKDIKLDLESGLVIYSKNDKERSIKIGKYLQYWISGFKKLMKSESELDALKQASIMYRQFGKPNSILSAALRKFGEDYLYAQELSVDILKDLEDINKKFGLKQISDEDKQFAIMITNVPIDVVRMSDFCYETNCHTEGEKHFLAALEEASSGAEVIYLIRKEEFDEIVSQVDFEDILSGKEEVFSDPKRNTGIPDVEPIARMRARSMFHLPTETSFHMPTTKYFGDRTTNWEDTVFDIYRSREEKKYDIISDYIKRNGNVVEADDFFIYGGYYDDADWSTTFEKMFPWIDGVEGSPRIDHQDIFDELFSSGYHNNIEEEVELEFRQAFEDIKNFKFVSVEVTEQEPKENYLVGVNFNLVLTTDSLATSSKGIDENKFRQELKKQAPKFPLGNNPIKIEGYDIAIPIRYSVEVTTSRVGGSWEGDGISYLANEIARQVSSALYKYESLLIKTIMGSQT